jgi:hypothetical protein
VAVLVLKTPQGGHANPKALAFFLPFSLCCAREIRVNSVVIACRAWAKYKTRKGK